MKRQIHGAWWLAVPVACLLAAPVAAWSQEQDQADQERQRQSQQEQQDQQSPEFFDQLNLDEEQKNKIKEILKKHQQQTAHAWRQFQQLHMKAVAMEAALVASLDKSLTDQQRQTLAQREREQAQARRELGYRPDQERSRQFDRDQPQQQATPDAQRQETQRDELQRQLQQRQPGQTEGRQQAAGPGQEGKAFSLLIIEVAPADQRYGSLDLSPEQRQKHEGISTAYTQRIRQTWRQLHNLHAQMVKSEAQKLSELEEVLTDEQLQKLHELRTQHQPDAQQQPGASQEPKTKNN